MARELSAILDHIEKIGELDLDGVPPTSHVVEVAGALREDVPRPSLPREVALDAGAGRERRRLPRPEPGGVSAERALSSPPRRPPSGSRAATSRAAGAVRGLPRARRRRRRRAQRFTWVAGEDGASGAQATRRLAGVPLAVKDLFCTEGVPSQAGSKILEGYRPPYTATAVARLADGRRAAARQDQPGRVRDGLLERELRLRPGAQPVGPRARARRLLRRQRRRRRGRARRRGRSAPTPAARSASRPRCAGSSG